ncbi:inositol monophosphatase [Candidatus Woesearchaeota archaeon]|nr:inositol monophosphatase [Candidatus Woesearchaeota archaeon]
MKSFLTKISLQSGKILMSNYGKIKFIRVKDKLSYVTNADLESEKCIISAIRKKFPSHDIVSEESGSLGKNSDYRWFIDPLDGTHNYINKIPLFGVSIALEHNGKVILGAISLPCLDELYIAEKGKGAFLNGKRIRVSGKKELKKSFILTDLVLRYNPETKLKMLNRLKGLVYDIRVLGSSVYAFAAVAKGSADAYVTALTNSWDMAAGALIVEEANGKVTDFNGKEWKAEKGRFLSSNKKIHDKLLKLLR